MGNQQFLIRAMHASFQAYARSRLLLDDRQAQAKEKVKPSRPQMVSPSAVGDLFACTEVS
jgi:hypothetical protein